MSIAYIRTFMERLLWSIYHLFRLRYDAMPCGAVDNRNCLYFDGKESFFLAIMVILYALEDSKQIAELAKSQSLLIVFYLVAEINRLSNQFILPLVILAQH